jgi:hypothetical protein
VATCARDRERGRFESDVVASKISRMGTPSLGPQGWELRDFLDSDAADSARCTRLGRGIVVVRTRPNPSGRTTDSGWSMATQGGMYRRMRIDAMARSRLLRATSREAF